MPELGKTLSQARVTRGLTLEDCERDTRISKRYLDALEREDWKIFPAPVYSRAFLRTYAQYLSLDPQQLMRMYQAQEEPEIKPLPEVRATPATGSMNWTLASIVAAFLVIAGAFLYLSSRSDGDNDDPSVASPGDAVPTSAPEGQGGGPQPGLGRPVGEVEKDVVPDLAGVRIDDAIAALKQAEIDYLIVETDTAAGTPGVITSQSPASGSDADGSTSVTLVVPRG
ncbi:MAG: helix-turn-helix domain-containing protein [Dehalococcoidia bacterium]